ncbi:unnamed protein product [Dovyalis caffra]|uniref:Uncharacterized protein n=1 Tax=Dovyalis caffra TaxID=77055 RepID=A0AAV1QPZ3_9ROSI|nr:unnamed protein product [Dovyalis caffra]
MDASVNGELSEHPLVSIVKNSPVWDMIESLDVFQKMPQKPHFNPLIKCKEIEREGYAIGKMVQFATVVEKTSGLQLGNPINVFDSYLKTLADLKRYGFDVEVVVYRINCLLSIKESQVQLQSTSKEVETQILKSTCERIKLEEDIEAINKKIRELEEERGLALSKKESKDSEITSLQMQSRGISADISKAILDFENQATASWHVEFRAKMKPYIAMSSRPHNGVLREENNVAGAYRALNQEGQQMLDIRNNRTDLPIWNLVRMMADITASSDPIAMGQGLRLGAKCRASPIAI